MDDKKKIIFLSIAVVVAIGLIVLITLTKRGGETAPAPSLPAVPTPTFPAGTYTGVSGGTGGSGGQGGAGQTGNTAAVSSPAGFNAFVYGSATSSSALGAGNYNEYLHIKPAPAQPKASVPTMNISENDIVAEVTKELKGQIRRLLGPRRSVSRRTPPSANT